MAMIKLVVYAFPVRKKCQLNQSYSNYDVRRYKKDPNTVKEIGNGWKIQNKQ